MTTVHIIKPAKPMLNSFEFASYNEAASFAKKSSALSPSKPYKRVRAVGAPVWMVSVVNKAALRSKADVLTLRDWQPCYLGINSHPRQSA